MSREPMDIAKELRDASPQEAADLWTIPPSDRGILGEGIKKQISS